MELTTNSIADALELIAKPEFHMFWRDHWNYYIKCLEEYNGRLKARHELAVAELEVSPCPVDLSNGLIPGSDDEWEYQQWLDANKPPELVLWSANSASTCPLWVDVQKDNTSAVRYIADTFNGASGWIGIMTNPKALLAVDGEGVMIEMGSFIKSCTDTFLRVAANSYPDEWATYCHELDQAKIAEADRAANARIASSNEAALQAVAPLVETGKCTSIADASRLMINLASQFEVLAEALPALAANSHQQDLISAQDMAATQECVFKLYSCNCSQLKGVQELCRWLAAGRTGKNRPISMNVTRTVYNWLLESISDDGIKNTVFEPWFMEHVEGTRLHNAICQRIGAIPPKSVVIALTRSRTLMQSL